MLGKWVNAFLVIEVLKKTNLHEKLAIRSKIQNSGFYAWITSAEPTRVTLTSSRQINRLINEHKKTSGSNTWSHPTWPLLKTTCGRQLKALTSRQHGHLNHLNQVQNAQPPKRPCRAFHTVDLHLLSTQLSDRAGPRQPPPKCVDGPHDVRH